MKFPHNGVGMKFQHNGVGMKFPQAVCWNCILFIILPPGPGRWENSELFLATPEVDMQPRLTLRKDSEHSNLFMTPL